jgi:rhodanese-related sulfurtransferase
MSGMSVAQLSQALDGPTPPLVIDVRRREAFLKDTKTLRGALRRDPDYVAQWARELPSAESVVVACVHGHQVSQGVAEALNAEGRRAFFLEGGFADWQAGGGQCDSKPEGASTRWVTRERPKIDRIACSWLISRFVDKDAEFLYFPANEVRDVAKARHATPFDVADAYFSNDGDLCSFDAFLRHYRLNDPALRQLAIIVRGADTGRPELAPQVPGLVSISLGLSRNFADDHEMLAHGMVMYDALYAATGGDPIRPPVKRSDMRPWQ